LAAVSRVSPVPDPGDDQAAPDALSAVVVRIRGEDRTVSDVDDPMRCHNPWHRIEVAGVFSLGSPRCWAGAPG
jgi:hypothetical protein